MIKITPASIDDLKIVKEIAYKTWPLCYADILSSEQMNYMLDKFYNLEYLTQNIENGHVFLLAKEDNINLGFASYETNYKAEKKTHLHKNNKLPEAQGKGIGKLLLNQVEYLAKENHSTALSLNVNKFNKAQDFYKKNGFNVIDDVVIEIGHNYIMDDYIMEKEL